MRQTLGEIVGALAEDRGLPDVVGQIERYKANWPESRGPTAAAVPGARGPRR